MAKINKRRWVLRWGKCWTVVVVAVVVMCATCPVSAQNDGSQGNSNNAEVTTTTSTNDGTTKTAKGACQSDTCVHGVCSETASGAASCTCKPGWTGNTCSRDVNECVRKNTCDQECQNTDGSYVCSCYPGYKLVGAHVCEDVDECLNGTAHCGSNEFCVNSQGGFACVCRPGFGGKDCKRAVSNVYGGVLTFQGLHSRGQGWSPDLLQLHTDTFKTLATKVETAVDKVLKTQGVPHINVTVVKFSQWNRDRQLIQAAFQVSMSSPADIGELEAALQTGFTQCVQDVCQFGQGGDFLVGVLKNETAFSANYSLCDNDRNNVCHDVTTDCVTVNGTAKCQCRAGFEPWGLYDNACRDINECLTGKMRDLCGWSSGATECHNIDGSYYCNCPKTQLWDAVQMKCIWFNICKRDKPCENGGRCYNTMDKNKAGFVCRCAYGWTGRVCGSLDPEVEKMKLLLLLLTVGLGVLCLLFIVVIIVLCVQRSRRKRAERRSAFGSYDFGNSPPPIAKAGESMNGNSPPPTAKAGESMNGSNLPPPVQTMADSTRGSHGDPNENPTLTATQGGVSAAVESPTPLALTKGVPTVGDSPTFSSTNWLPSCGESPAPSGKKRDSVSGSYDLGLTPRRSVRRSGRAGKVVTDATTLVATSNSCRLQDYSNRFISDRL